MLGAAAVGSVLVFYAAFLLCGLLLDPPQGARAESPRPWFRRGMTLAQRLATLGLTVVVLSGAVEVVFCLRLAATS